jgi:hypothetical protein
MLYRNTKNNFPNCVFVALPRTFGLEEYYSGTKYRFQYVWFYPREKRRIETLINDYAEFLLQNPSEIAAHVQNENNKNLEKKRFLSAFNNKEIHSSPFHFFFSRNKCCQRKD